MSAQWHEQHDSIKIVIYFRQCNNTNKRIMITNMIKTSLWHICTKINAIILFPPPKMYKLNWYWNQPTYIIFSVDITTSIQQHLYNFCFTLRCNVDCTRIVLQTKVKTSVTKCEKPRKYAMIHEEFKKIIMLWKILLTIASFFCKWI